MSEELKPCPFCGGKARVREIRTSVYNPVLRIECEDCHCSIGDFYANSHGRIEEVWNRRDVYASTRMKYCPFCSSKPHIQKETVNGHDCYKGICGSCFVETQLYSSVDEAVEAWNRRVQQ